MTESQALESESRFSNYSTTVKDPQFLGWRLYLYIQMEFCPGLNLKEYLKEKNLDKRKGLMFFRKLLDGVKAIHSRGILHRDLKPANIFLDDNENIKIGDFGLASLDNSLYQERKMASPNSFAGLDSLKDNQSNKVGTPLYTSPEQETGIRYDQKTDIYSLGLIFYEMLGKFETEHQRYISLTTLRNKHKINEPFASKNPKETELILKMASNNPEERPTAEQLIGEIDKLLANTETTSSSVSTERKEMVQSNNFSHDNQSLLVN